MTDIRSRFLRCRAPNNVRRRVHFATSTFEQRSNPLGIVKARSLVREKAVARDLRFGSAPDVGFSSHSVHHVRVVQLECRALRTDSGQLGEVVPRRWAAGRPLQ